MCLFRTCNEFRGSQWDALASVCTQVTVWHSGVAVAQEGGLRCLPDWVLIKSLSWPWGSHCGHCTSSEVWRCGKEEGRKGSWLQQCFPIICHPNTWLHFSDSLNKIEMWWIYAMVVSKNTIIFCFDSQSLSISVVWSPLLHIISLCSRPNSSALEKRCPWSLALCVMLYWEVITRYDKTKSAHQEYGFRCNNLEQGKKIPWENNQNSTVCASAQGGERQAPVMIILWDSIVFGTQTVVWSAFQESLSKTRKAFPIWKEKMT